MSATLTAIKTRLTFTKEELEVIYVMLAGEIAGLVAQHELAGRSAIEIRTLTAELRAFQGRFEDAIASCETKPVKPETKPTASETAPLQVAGLTYRVGRLEGKR